jgi:hypothetical protein
MDANLTATPTSAARAPLTPQALRETSERFRGTGGCSQDNAGAGFRPAFLDKNTGAVYAACFADGRPAPFHLLDGLPPALILSRDADGRVASVRPGVVSGFSRQGRFYSREQAARVVERAVRRAHRDAEAVWA